VQVDYAPGIPASRSAIPHIWQCSLGLCPDNAYGGGQSYIDSGTALSTPLWTSCTSQHFKNLKFRVGPFRSLETLPACNPTLDLQHLLTLTQCSTESSVLCKCSPFLPARDLRDHRSPVLAGKVRPLCLSEGRHSSFCNVFEVSIFTCQLSTFSSARPCVNLSNSDDPRCAQVMINHSQH
jgi:hypothetical protein